LGVSGENIELDGSFVVIKIVRGFMTTTKSKNMKRWEIRCPGTGDLGGKRPIER